ncbi:MAG TPA: ATP-binding protein [Casimicrobiaceae bacterium]|nr:ATP-binding protein [Casimicrobiaceae bacterium]
MQSILEARQRAESALRQSESRLRAILGQATAGVAETDLTGRFTLVNPTYCRIVGRPADEVYGLRMQDITHPDDSTRNLTLFDRLVTDGEPFEIEKRYVRPNGEPVWVSNHVSPIIDADGKPYAAVTIVQDISERKRTEQALLEETRMLELVNRTGMALTAELDLQALLQAVTDAATQLSGANFGAFFYNLTNASGDSYRLYTLSGVPRDAFAKFDQPRATPLFGPTFRGDAAIRIDDVVKDPRYGQVAPHYGMPKGHLPVRSYLAVPVISRRGEVIGGLFFGHVESGVFSDRSERLVTGLAAQAAVAIDNAHLYAAAQEAAEERAALLESERLARTHAERMSALKDQFLATLSHELRTPLSAILGWSQVLRLRTTPPADVDQGLQTIERNARVQIQLIEDLLDMSRIAAGKLRLDVQQLQPIAFVEAAIATMQPAIDAKGLRLERFLDPAAGPVSGDPNRLQQVVWNLLANAVKFTPKGGKVQLRLERVNSHIEIAVADTGIGIKGEFLPHVFEQFRQADASTTREHGGLGLGLSIVKHLVELHGGTVRAASPGDGQGATFSVQLPVTILHETDPPEPRVHPASSAAAAFDLSLVDLSDVKVLVIDDEPDACLLIKRVLTECHAEVATASSAAEALALLQEKRPHVLVSDIGMPGVDGYQLLRRVRALGPARGGDVPAIALTAFARSEDRTRALRAGFALHLAKPVEPSELIATVASIAGRTGEK